MNLAVLKRFQFDEKRNVELRTTFYDVFNKPNFRVGGWTGNSQTSLILPRLPSVNSAQVVLIKTRLFLMIRAVE
jgi:hypothetical protein